MDIHFEVCIGTINATTELHMQQDAEHSHKNNILHSQSEMINTELVIFITEILIFTLINTNTFQLFFTITMSIGSNLILSSQRFKTSS
jgi:hypothetical protein